MASIQYNMISGLFKLMGVNEMLDKQGADFDKLLATYSKKQEKPLSIPYKKMESKFNIETKTVGEGMMHCWGAMEFVPEARAVRLEYFNALR